MKWIVVSEYETCPRCDGQKFIYVEIAGGLQTPLGCENCLGRGSVLIGEETFKGEEDY